MNWIELATKHMAEVARVRDETVEGHFGPETLLLASIAESLEKIAESSKSTYQLMMYNK